MYEASEKLNEFLAPLRIIRAKGGDRAVTVGAWRKRLIASVVGLGLCTVLIEGNLTREVRHQTQAPALMMLATVPYRRVKVEGAAKAWGAETFYPDAAAQHIAGFTLIELSIVLVVIGLIVGGVLVGRDLISASQVRAQVSQIGAFDAAVATFKTKFDYLPGDIPNPANFGLQADTANAYCNQNSILGDGLIDDVNKNYPVLWTNCKPAIFFMHLSQANLLKDISGIIINNTVECGGAVTAYTNYVGCQFPAAKIGTGGFTATSLSNGNLAYFLGMTATAANATYNNFNIPYGSSNGVGVITPTAALALDSKMDDGLPLTGKIQASQFPATAETRSNYCLTSVAANTYNISNPNIACNLLIQSSGR